MPATAERVAAQWSLTREELDLFALHSHQRAVDAIKQGRFASEIVPVPTPAGDVTLDEGPRADTDMYQLSRLKPVNGPEGLVTAGNSSPINDGAAAVVVVSERYADRHNLRPQARLVAAASVGVPPSVMGIGPVPATGRALERADWSVSDLDAVEINEAFASQSLACIRDLGLDESIVNADGGAIALGHPLGASGARILVTLVGRMERESASRGLATMCVGVGQGTSLLVERV
jgi:acetyl-CoA acetyltransferase family protein